MYEEETHEAVRRRMLNAVSAALDKREGSIIYDATASAAIEIELLYVALDWFLKNTFGDTAERPFLIERALERGLKPYAATNAVIKGTFEPAAVEVSIGSRFSCDELTYAVSEKLGAGTYLLTCEQVGRAGNKSSGRLVPIGYVTGLQTAQINELTIPGRDEEDTEAFRARYLKSFDAQAYGGNIADYKEKVRAIAGVGGVKVYPVWNGGGTVKVVFCTSENTAPTAEFIAKVQEILDPVPYAQQGVGIAPIGHRVTVEGAVAKAVTVRVRLTLNGGATVDMVKPVVEKALNAYFAELNAGWKDTQVVNVGTFTNTGLIVRRAKIESLILDIAGVVDVESLTLNGAAENVHLGKDGLAALGGVTYE